LYPRWWRERYSEEFGALLDDSRPGLWGAVDVFKGALAMQLSTFSPKLAIWGAAAGLLAGIVAAFTLTPKYESTATLSIPGSLTNQEAVDQINTITKQVLGRTTLVRVIKDLQLYPEERKKMAAEDVLAMMRSDIRISWREGLSAIDVAFRYPDGTTAQRTLEALTVEFQKVNVPVSKTASRPENPVSSKRNISLAGLAIGAVFGTVVALLVSLMGRFRKRAAQPISPPSSDSQVR
jgi:capsular polysaccharide biosynthesis protein